MGHCCFCAAVSQAPDLVFILILGSFLPIVAINEISTLLYPVVVAIVGAVFLTTKIKTRDSLILIIFQLCSHQTYASYLIHISSSHSLFSSSLSKTLKGGWGAKFVSTWLPAWFTRKEPGASGSLTSHQKSGATDLSVPLLAFRLLQEGHHHCPWD